MKFSVVWAASAPAYVGMIFGVIMMMRLSNGSAPTGTDQFSLYGVIIGMFFGGAIGLPLAASNLVAALVTRLVTSDAGFAVTFAVFTALSAFGGVLLVNWLGKLFGMTQGGGMGAWGSVVGFWAASIGLAFLLMALRLKPNYR